MSRKRLPNTRKSVTHKVVIHSTAGIDPKEPIELVITIGLYEDGTPGEVFLRTTNLHKGIYEAFATGMSLGLQHKVPFETYFNKHAWSQFEPCGMVTVDPAERVQIRSAKSIPDYLVRWMSEYFKLVSPSGV